MKPPVLHAHPLDHLVLPVGDLAVARERLGQLGFTVAPNGIHPFGTQNCCVYFSDDTFLEPLAVGDETRLRAATSEGNVFAARQLEFQMRNGPDGFSALVFGTDDATEDDAGFREKDISAGAMLDFSRPFTDASGQTGTASFRLAFAADTRSPDLFFFTCQRINAPKVDRASLQTHANGVTDIERIVLRAGHPANHAGILIDASGASHAEGILASSICVRTPNATIDILAPSDLRSAFGLAGKDSTELLAEAIVFATSDLGAVEGLLRANSITSHRHGSRIIVPPTPGQGAIFIFEESS